jgi:6-phosphogluconolactonase (cycloisomerase 2 family)
MEINQRMSKRSAWLLGVVVLVSIGVLVACGSNYNASSDGLILVGSQGSGLIETFSFNLNNGGSSAVSNTPEDTSSLVCVLKGIPSSIVIDPKGQYAYTIINANTSCDSPTFSSTNGILAFKINSDGTTTAVGSQVSFNNGTVTILGTATTETVPVVPGMMVMDPAGKFLFVADRATTDTHSPQRYIPGSVSVFAIGSGGAVTEIAGSPFFTAASPTTLIQQGLDFISVAPTPTVFPAIGANGIQNSVCSTVGLPPPTSQYLYAVDNLGNQVFEFVVDMTSGVLTNPNPLNLSPGPPFTTDQRPEGIAVDPCNRFVYVTDSLTDRISAYTICNGSPNQSSTCLQSPNGFLVQVSGSPFPLTGSPISPGPLVVDPYGNYVYVLGTGSNTINLLKISPVSGAVSALTPATVATGLGPRQIAIRGDDNWLFVTNNGTGALGGTTVSQYSVTPASGALTVLPAIETDDYPWGLAVK